MKLVIIIPAYNEEKDIQNTIRNIPKKIHGINETEILVVDDGSTDKTVDLAMNAGANKVVSHHNNIGVGAAFMTGVRNAISEGADIVVTIDADSQFDSNQIPELILPILNQQADVVVGSRFLKNIPQDIPRIKTIGNKIFTRIVSWTLDQKFTDTQTGFRAYSKEALLNISIVNDFTYTQEVLIDLKLKGTKILEIPVRVKYDPNRKSRVVKNIFSYSLMAMSIIVKTLVYHRPIMAFGLFGAFLCALGIIGKVLAITNVIGLSAGLTTGFIILGVVSFMMGMFANVVFKRQAFTEKDLRHYLSKLNKDKENIE